MLIKFAPLIFGRIITRILFGNVVGKILNKSTNKYNKTDKEKLTPTTSYENINEDKDISDNEENNNKDTQLRSKFKTKLLNPIIKPFKIKNYFRQMSDE